MEQPYFEQLVSDNPLSGLTVALIQDSTYQNYRRRNLSIFSLLGSHEFGYESVQDSEIISELWTLSRKNRNFNCFAARDDIPFFSN